MSMLHHKVKIFFRRIAKTFAFCILLIIVFEAGLELKFYLKKRSLEASRIESKNGHVLVIGDSVLGNSSDKKSIYSRLENKIEKGNQI